VVRARQDLVTLGGEIRTARVRHDLSQRVVAKAMGISTATLSRLERGQAPNASLVMLGRGLAVVGLHLSARAYPGGSPLRDEARVRLLSRFHARLGSGVRWHTEVPLPKAGDLRAWDGVAVLPTVRVGVEAETRVRDAQDLQRRLTLKRRDGGVDHVVLLLADTRHHRAFLRSCPDSFLAEFPVPGRLALARLASPADPGGSSIGLL
jgi:transcriptional regulator with XRE-family HTH domain